jgi:hypothetical protein
MFDQFNVSFLAGLIQARNSVLQHKHTAVKSKKNICISNTGYNVHMQTAKTSMQSIQQTHNVCQQQKFLASLFVEVLRQF